MTLTVAFWASSSAGVLAWPNAHPVSGCPWLSSWLASNLPSHPSVCCMVGSACSQMYRPSKCEYTGFGIADALHQCDLAGVEELLDAGHHRVEADLRIQRQDLVGGDADRSVVPEDTPGPHKE